MLDTDTYTDETLDTFLGIRLMEDEKLRLKRIGKSKRRSTSFLAREAIREYIEKEEDKIDAACASAEAK